MKLSQLYIITALLWAIAAPQALADVNSSQALDICQDSIRARTDGSVYHKFRNRPAISTRGGKYTFWINSTLKNEERKYLLRSKCEISKAGEIQLLEIEEGRW